LGTNIVVQYSVGLIITFHGRITTREYVNRSGNQVHPMFQRLFSSEQRCSFPRLSAPIHTASTFQSWIEEHESELSTFPGQHNHHI
jgi:hypothetical protein